MSTLQSRVGELMRETGATHADLIRVTSKSSSAVSQIIHGPTKTLKADTAGALEREYGYRAEWLATGKLPKKVPHAPDLVARESDGTVRVAQVKAPQASAHWRAVADELAKQIRAADATVDPMKFLLTVDLLAGAVPEGRPVEPDDIAPHLRLVVNR